MEFLLESGEGKYGHVQPYRGALNVKAIRSTISRLKCRGNRWCKLYVSYGYGYGEDVGDDIRIRVDVCDTQSLRYWIEELKRNARKE